MINKEYESQSIAKGQRISPEKARLFANLVRGKKCDFAIKELMFRKSKAAAILIKTIKAACADLNCKFGLELLPESFMIKEVRIDGGTPLRGFTTRARGASDRLTKPTSHFVVKVAAPENFRQITAEPKVEIKKKEVV